MTHGASSMKRAVMPVRPRRTSQKRVEATRHARARWPFSSISLNTGTNADESAASATRARRRFGTWKATVNALISPWTPKYRRTTISRTSPISRDPAVAREKSAVERASRRRRAAGIASAITSSDGAPAREVCSAGLLLLGLFGAVDHPGSNRREGGARSPRRQAGRRRETAGRAPRADRRGDLTRNRRETARSRASFARISPIRSAWGGGWVRLNTRAETLRPPRRSHDLPPPRATVHEQRCRCVYARRMPCTGRPAASHA